jgi:hypothetical protein
MGFDLGHFLSDAGKAIGKAADSVVHAIGDATVWPFKVAVDIAKGQRIDRAFMDGFKTAIHSIKVLGPYVQAVISFVPGIGTVVGAAIGGGIALAEGKPIDEVMMSAVAGAVPGGVFVKDAYEIGKAAAEKKPILQVIEKGVLDMASSIGVIIPDSAKDVLMTGLGMSQQTIHGIEVAADDVKTVINKIPDPLKRAAITEAMKPGSKINVADVVLDSALDMVPGIDSKSKTEIKHGMAIGMAMTHGKILQTSMTKDAQSPSAKHNLTVAGAAIASTDPVISAARKNLQGDGLTGFDAAVALAHRPGTTQTQLLAVRNSLGLATNAQGVPFNQGPAATYGQDRRHHWRGHSHERHQHKWSNQQLGFDTALALHIGRKANRGYPSDFSHRQRAAHAIAIGLRNAPETIADPVLHTVNDQESAKGVHLAARQESVNIPLLATVGLGGIGLVFAGPVGGVIGLGLGYVLSKGGVLTE